MIPLTILGTALTREAPGLLLAPVAGYLTVQQFSPAANELRALSQGCGIFDLGWQSFLAVRGEDQLRWLSGMVTNAVQQLAAGEGNYSFLLNAQGRIQGDAYVFRQADQLLLQTEADHVKPILAHLDRFIIMDDVTLEDGSETLSSIGLSGSTTPSVLAAVGCAVPDLDAAAAAVSQTSLLAGVPVTVAVKRFGSLLRYEVWAAPAEIPSLWKQLLAAGAEPCGLEAVEALRVLEGLPRYGIDLVDRDLPQETSQTRALNFTKGCYLGQEIVERIRSRGAVHRALRQFAISDLPAALPADLLADGTTIGRLTSAATLPVADEAGGRGRHYALAVVRTEALSRGAALTYNQGTALLLDRPPTLFS